MAGGVSLATLRLRVEKSEVDAAASSLDRLTAAGARTEGSATKLTGTFRGQSQVARDVGRAMRDGVADGAAQSEKALRKVELASFALINAGGLSHASLGRLTGSLIGVAGAAGAWVAIAGTVVSTIYTIANANKEAAARADEAAEAERKRINELSRPVVQRVRSPEEDISALRNRAQANRDRAAAMDEVINALYRQARAEEEVQRARMSGGLVTGIDVRRRGEEDPRELRERAAALRELADARRLAAAAQIGSADTSQGNLGANRVRDLNEERRKFLKSLQDELDLVGLRGPALQRQIALNSGLGQTFADLVAKMQAAIEKKRALLDLESGAGLNFGRTPSPEEFSAVTQAFMVAEQRRRDIQRSTSAEVARERINREMMLLSIKDQNAALEKQKQTQGEISNAVLSVLATTVNRGPLGGLLLGGLQGGLEGGPLGAGLGAFTGLMSGLVESFDSSNTALRQLEDGLASFRRTVEDAGSPLSDLEEQIRDVRRANEEMRRGLEDQAAQSRAREREFNQRALGDPFRPTTGGQAQRDLDELNRLEAERIEQLRREAELLQQTRLQNLDVRRLRALGLEDEAFELQQYMELTEARRRHASELEIATLLETQRAEAMRRASDEIERTIEGLGRTIDGLDRFRDSLSLNPQLSILSPIQQLREARRQYEEELGRARGGDQEAAGRLSSVAQAFLTASRRVNASGTPFVSDFTRVQDELGEVRAMFENQRSIQQQQLDELRRLRENSDREWDWRTGGPGSPGSNPQNPNTPGPGNWPPADGGGNPLNPQDLSALHLAGYTALLEQLRADNAALRLELSALRRAVEGSALMN